MNNEHPLYRGQNEHIAYNSILWINDEYINTRNFSLYDSRYDKCEKKKKK